MTEDNVDRQMVAFLAGVRAASLCWLEGDGAATELQQIPDFEAVLAALRQCCYTEATQAALPSHCQQVIPDICGVLVSEMKAMAGGNGS